MKSMKCVKFYKSHKKTLCKMMQGCVSKFLRPQLLQHCLDSNVEQVQNILSERQHELSLKTLNECFVRCIRDAPDTEEHIEIVRLLLEYGANINHIQEGYYERYSPLQWAIGYMKPNLIKELILQGADINYVADKNCQAYEVLNAFDMLSLYFSKKKKELHYLMLFRGATLDKYSKHKFVIEKDFFNWETEMLVYCLERKGMPYLILAFELN